MRRMRTKRSMLIRVKWDMKDDKGKNARQEGESPHKAVEGVKRRFQSAIQVKRCKQTYGQVRTGCIKIDAKSPLLPCASPLTPLSPAS